jgi:hypothetical protein
MADAPSFLDSAVSAMDTFSRANAGRDLPPAVKNAWGNLLTEIGQADTTADGISAGTLMPIDRYKDLNGKEQAAFWKVGGKVVD